jgi:hypothetical protein
MKLAEIVSIARDRNMIKTIGKTPESTLGSDLLMENRRKERRGEAARFRKVSLGTWEINT